MCRILSKLKEQLLVLKNSIPSVKIALLAGLTGYIVGFYSGFMTLSWSEVPARRLLKVVSSIASMVGAILSTFCNYRTGRITTLVAADAVFLIGIFFATLTAAIPVQILAHSVIGLALGVALATSPLLVSETAPAAVRGCLVGIHGIFMGLGQSSSLWTEVVFSLLGVEAYQRGLPVALVALLQLSIFLRSEYRSMGLTQEGSREDFPSMIWQNLKKKTVQKGVLAALCVNVLKEVISVESVIFYGPAAMEMAGFNKMSFGTTINIVSWLGTGFSWTCVDVVGRKSLIIYPLSGISIASFLLFLQFNGLNFVLGPYAIAMILLVTFFYCIAFSSIPLTLNSEVHASEFRGFGFVIAHIAGAIIALMRGVSFTNVEDWSGPFIFVLNTIFSALGVVSVIFFVPETSNTDLNEMEEVLRKF